MKLLNGVLLVADPPPPLRPGRHLSRALCDLNGAKREATRMGLAWLALRRIARPFLFRRNRRGNAFPCPIVLTDSLARLAAWAGGIGWLVDFPFPKSLMIKGLQANPFANSLRTIQF